MKKLLSITLAVVLALTLTGVSIMASQYGAEDPLISKSYLENDFFAKVTAYIDSKISGSTGSSSAGNASYEVITLTQGQKLVSAGGSIEIILRPGGSAVVYSEISGNGLADLTSGAELLGGYAVPVNACCLVPRNDGRGIVCTSAKAYVMVRGQYEIK